MANGRSAVIGAFVGSVVIITWRELKKPSDSNAPLPAPSPYRYVDAGVAYGLLALVADFFSDTVAGTLAVGLFIGLAMQTAVGTSSGATTTSSNSVLSAGGNLISTVFGA